MNNKFDYYIFIEQLNDNIINNIIKLKNQKKKIYIIIIGSISDLILKFVKKNQIPFYITDNLKLGIKHKAEGIFLTSKNKTLKNSMKEVKNFSIIGSAHNQLEYFIKNRQGCSMIMLSPIFYNSKYSHNQILNPIRFNLITKNWKNKICALGGVNSKNIKLINLTRCNSVGIKSLITLQA
jgi:thiamine monophosphate synthase